jgi:uncharacterized repeat protein (TIGR02543 family)
LHLGWADYLVEHYKVGPGGDVLTDSVTLQGQIGTVSPAATPNSYTGYVFDAARSNVQGLVTVSPGLVLRLHYNAIPVQVLFDAAGGEPVPAQVASWYDEKLVEPTVPVRAGYAFVGWWSADPVRGWVFNTDRLTAANGVAGVGQGSGRLVLTAKWAAAPTASGARATIGVGGTTTLTGSVSADTQAGASIVSAVVTTSASWVGQADISPDLSGSVQFEANSLPAGVYPFTVRYTDSNGLAVDADFEVTVVDAPEVTGETSARIGVNGLARFELAVTSGTVIESAVVAGAPPGVSVTAGTDGTVVFDAAGLDAGTYQFTVTYTDSLEQTEVVTFTVVVQAPPVAVGVERPVAVGGSVLFPEDVSTTGVIVSRVVTATPEAGSVETGPIVYHAEDAAPGRYTFEVTYTDDLGQTGTATFTAWVLAAPSPATVVVDVAFGQETPLLDPVSVARVDGAGDLVVSEVIQPAHGTVSPDGDGYRYTPEAGYSGQDTWSAVVCDQIGQCATVTYTMQVAPKPITPTTPGTPTTPSGSGGSGGSGSGDLPFTGPSLEPAAYAGLAAAMLTLITVGLAMIRARRRVQVPEPTSRHGR